ncbi:hypothetical protein [Roseibium sp. M-1]
MPSAFRMPFLGVATLCAACLFQTEAAYAFLQVTIEKGAAIGTVSGGDGGPGQVSEGGAVNYCWSLPVANLMTGVSHSQQEITQTLNSALGVIGSVSMTASQSVPLDASGEYDGVTLCFGGTGLGTGASGGQLQILGQNVNLSGVKDPNFADLSWLPTGSFGALPVSGQSTGHVTLIIKD